MRVDDEQAAYAGVIGPITDLLDEIDHRDGLKRDGAGPASAMTDRAAIGKRRQQRNIQLLCHSGGELVGYGGVDAAAEMRAVLFGGADGKDCGFARSRQIGGK